jgi:serine/threonine protein kinase
MKNLINNRHKNFQNNFLSDSIEMASPRRAYPIQFTSKYKLGKLINTGASGSVYKGKHIATDSRVAIKIIKSTNDKDNQAIEKETNILKLCDHPHIVNYMDYYSECLDNVNTTHYIVMEYVTHGELFDYLLKSQRLDERKCRKIIGQLVSALEYCHGNLITHRDIKLENILVHHKKKLHIKLADFGLANNVNLDTLHRTKCETPQYVAPEIITAELNGYNPMGADIWSLGVVLCTLSEGCFPWESDKPADIMKEIVEYKYEYRTDFSDGLNDLLSHILVVDINDRYSLSQIKSHPWLSGYTLPSYLKPRIAVSNIDMILVEKIASLGFNVEDIVVSLALNQNTQMTAIYNILCDRFKIDTTKNLVDSPRKISSARKENKRICNAYKKASSSDTSLMSKKYLNIIEIGADDESV